jgi:hypothetical protein
MRLVQKFVPRGSATLVLRGGYGPFSLRLLDNGYRAKGPDLDPSDWKVPGVQVRAFDLNRPIASPPGPYHAVVAIEVIEHLHNPYKFLPDCRRMMRTGAVLIFSTPNLLDLDPRRIFLTTGQFFNVRKGCVFSTGHTMILPSWLLEQVLEIEGFRVRRRTFFRRKKQPWLRNWPNPLVNLCLLPLGLGITLDAVFAPTPSVAYVVDVAPAAPKEP